MDNGLDMYPQGMPQRHPGPLSINTSFSQDWAPNSPFSSSPSTPQLYQPSPSTCPTPLGDVEDAFSMADFNLESYDHPSTYVHQPFHMTQSAFLPPDFDALSKEAAAFGLIDQSKVQLAGQDLDFSDFMSSFESTYTI